MQIEFEEKQIQQILENLRKTNTGLWQIIQNQYMKSLASSSEYAQRR